MLFLNQSFIAILFVFNLIKYSATENGAPDYEDQLLLNLNITAVKSTQNTIKDDTPDYFDQSLQNVVNSLFKNENEVNFVSRLSNYGKGKNASWLIRREKDQNFYYKHELEYEGYDGFYNNMARPDSGAIDGLLLRRVPNAYEDGVYKPVEGRPNPLLLSEKLLKGKTGTQSAVGRNAFIVYFGQQVVEEILDAQRPACPPEYLNIPIPPNHSYRTTYKLSELPVLRTRYDQRTGYSPNNPRQQLNEITPYLDGNLIYGTTKQWADQLRRDENGKIAPHGKLASSYSGRFPAFNTQGLPMANPPPPFYHADHVKNHETAKVSRFFKLGNPRGNENAFLLTFGVLWFRWHNHLADHISDLHPYWSNDKIFNEARKWTIATQQRIVMYEWLDQWVPGSAEALGPYKYDPHVDPQIDQFFQSVAFRFGHTLVTAGVYLRDYIRSGCKTKFDDWGKNTVRTCNIYWRPQEPMLTLEKENGNVIDIDRLIMGMTTQFSEREDNKIVEDLRGNVFGPLEFPRRDLMAINIQRGRDHGLPDYNTAREAYDLPRITFDDFSNFGRTRQEIEDLKQMYNHDDKIIDAWVGGIWETTERGPGPLFSAVIQDQFRRIRNSDRFWYENYKMNKLFTKEEVDRINQISIYDVIMAVTKLDKDDIPKNPFRAPVEGSDTNLINRCKLSNTVRYNNITYKALPALNDAALNESCVQGDTYDYFSKSEVSFIATFIFIGTFVFGAVGVVFFLIHYYDKIKDEEEKKRGDCYRESVIRKSAKKECIFMVSAIEWIDKNTTRKVLIRLIDNKIELESFSGRRCRSFPLKRGEKITIYYVMDEPTLVIQMENRYDLVLKFEADSMRREAGRRIEQLISELEMQKTKVENYSFRCIHLCTQKERQEQLEKFFRVVFDQAFDINNASKKDKEIFKFNKDKKDIVHFQLTIEEFAESLGMKANNIFVTKLFDLTDKDKSGTINYEEFLSLLAILAKGDEKKKASLLFKIHDLDNTGSVSKEHFKKMMKSFLETTTENVDDKNLETSIEVMLKNANFEHKDMFSLEDFQKIIGDDVLNKTSLGFSGVKNSFFDKVTKEMSKIYVGRGKLQNNQQDTTNVIDKEEGMTIKKNETHEINPIIKYIELHAKEIFFELLYTLVLLAIFAERAYYYSVEREHSGLRRIAGYGVTVTRGAASAMMFTYSSLLVTMCRNTFTYLRNTHLSYYFPFDSMVTIHKFIGVWAFVFTLIHIIGHAFNFYHISTQTADDLTCLFRNFFHSTHELPKFHYWCWQTITGFTGVVLTLIWAVMYAFTFPIVRTKIYNWFWYTHNLYPLFFVFMILHGTGRLIQTPFTHYYLLGPLILFIIDTLISVFRKKIAIPVLKAEILPSDVTMLKFVKPRGFQYKSGQWIRIACTALNHNEYHPFTISSCPQEKELTVHIRAVGPWTRLIREVYQSVLPENELPKIYIDGPFGDSHQDWYTYEISILIGGGIGVTPFASILKDIVGGRSDNNICKKVYFMWVARTQKQFEWMLDIIREVEDKDEKGLISCHIFITEFYQKFDLRTTLLYVCENHYQRYYNKSMFTNLKAVTHFGRPNFNRLFKTIEDMHPEVDRFGIFSCGPPTLSHGVDQSVAELNKTKKLFEHHFKNF